MIAMIAGAARELRSAIRAISQVHIGPVIDAAAKQASTRISPHDEARRVCPLRRRNCHRIRRQTGFMSRRIFSKLPQSRISNARFSVRSSMSFATKRASSTVARFHRSERLWADDGRAFAHRCDDRNIAARRLAGNCYVNRIDDRRRRRHPAFRRLQSFGHRPEGGGTQLSLAFVLNKLSRSIRRRRAATQA